MTIVRVNNAKGFYLKSNSNSALSTSRKRFKGDGIRENVST